MNGGWRYQKENACQFLAVLHDFLIYMNRFLLYFFIFIFFFFFGCSFRYSNKRLCMLSVSNHLQQTSHISLFPLHTSWPTEKSFIAFIAFSNYYSTIWTKSTKKNDITFASFFFPFFNGKRKCWIHFNVKLAVECPAIRYAFNLDWC